MVCPNCGDKNIKVVDKRNNFESNNIRRRRECCVCDSRFTTYEKIENSNFVVRKKSGKLEDFDRSKVRKSLLKALNKRRVTENELDDLVDSIEVALKYKRKTEIPSIDIGKEILKLLRKEDHVAYILYATVYLDFESVDEIVTEIDKIAVDS